MSLGRKLSFDAGTTLGSNDRGVARSGWYDEPVARSHRDASVDEDEVDRAAGAIEKLAVTVLVFAVRVARRVGPSVHVTGFAAQRSLERAGVGRREFAVATVLDAQS
jgi:hypothetical protein